MSISCTNFCKGVVAALLLLSWPAGALELPPELLINGTPLDPYCLMALDEGDSTPMEGCAKKEGITILPDPPFEEVRGMTGFMFAYPSPERNVPYIYYRYLGKLDGLPALHILYSGGGSGNFSRVITVKRYEDKLHLVRLLAGGDRCNGGLANVRGEQGLVYYSQWLTPIDFLDLAHNNPHNLKAYDDLEASAMSCFGQANYEAGLPLSVSIGGEGEDPFTPQDYKGWTEKFRYQSCFNTLYRDTQSRGVKILDMAQLKSFTDDFNRLCVEKPPGEPEKKL